MNLRRAFSQMYFVDIEKLRVARAFIKAITCEIEASDVVLLDASL